jgi:short-subunit dehydrogenase
VPAARLSELYRTAFVTGASTGLGRAFAEMLLADGVRVWGTSRDVTRLAGLAGGPGGQFAPVRLELRDDAGTAEAFHAAEKAADGFDVVVNNAGYGVFGEFAEVDFPIWREQLEVMLLAPMRLSHLALGGMQARARAGRKSALVNISSLAAEFPLPFQSGYNAVKAGLSAFGESLMIDLRDSGVIVLDVRPGDYRTHSESAVLRPKATLPRRAARAWEAFVAMMQAAPEPAHAAAAVRRALLRGRSGTVRTGSFFQARLGPFLARFGSLALRRRIQARYFDAH